MRYALTTDDMKFFHQNGFVNAEDMVDYARMALDVLQAESQRGLPRLMNIGFHLRIIGRLGRFAAFEQILEMLAERQDDFWITNRNQIAKAFAENSPCM